MIWSAVKEFGAGWLICRALYSAKLMLLKKLPFSERFFEQNVDIRRIGILPDNTNRTERFIRNLPDNIKEELIRRANQAVEGTVIGFSSTEMPYGMPINWQLNPITGKSCDIRYKWYKIPDFDVERGDIKAVWEISRFSHFVTLARAYLATDDKKYYDAFSSQLESWLSENPYSYGANYKCGQECAFRMMNALLAYNVFACKKIANPKDEKNIRELIKRCYQKILSNFFYAHRCIKNNHTISELAGMIIGAWCSCDNKRLKWAYKKLEKVISEQFLPDGGYTQFSFNYQRLALQDIEYILLVSQKTGFGISENSIDRIRKSVELFYQCQDQTGDVPNYGFNDGALVFPVSSSGYRDFRPVIGSLYASLCGKRIYDEGIYDEEYLWFGGDNDPDLLVYEDKERKSLSFPDAGLFTLRGENRWMMAVSNDYKSRPGHMDQMHIDLWTNGINVLCDCGTYSYADKKGEALVLTGAHNTLKIDGKEQMNKHGAFMILDRTKRLFYKTDDGELSFAIRSKNGYTHERSIREYKNGYDICDKLTAESDRDFEILFHTPCEVICRDGKILLYNGKQHILTVESSLEFELKKGIRSVYYLSELPVSVLCFKGKTVNGNAESIIKLRTDDESDE